MKPGPPLLVLQVEVVVIDVHPLAREGEAGAAQWPGFLLALEAVGFFLGDTDEYDALVGFEISAIGDSDVIVRLVAFECHERNVLLRDEGVYGRNEPIVQGSDHGSRRNWEAQVVAEKRSQL